MAVERLSWCVPCPWLCEFPSLDSCRERFLLAHMEADLALPRVVSPALQVGDAEVFSSTWFKKKKALILSSESTSRVNVSHPQREDGSDRRLIQIEMLAKMMALLSQILFKLAIAAVADTILLRITRSGELRTQKLKSHLMRTQNLKVLPSKPGIGHYIALHATLTAREFFLGDFYPPVHTTAFFPKPLPCFFCVCVSCRPTE